MAIGGTNGEASAALIFGMPVYPSAVDTYVRAQANASGSCGVVGLIGDASDAHGAAVNVVLGGILSGSTAQWGAIITGTPAGLTFNADYWLDPATPGFITATAPSTVGQYVVHLGKALSTTEMAIQIYFVLGL